VRVVPPGLLRRIVLRARPGSAILARAPHDVDATDFDALNRPGFFGEPLV
jgi:hypothetical protein